MLERMTWVDPTESRSVEQWRRVAEERARRIDELEEELEIVYTSHSWRITAPLRGSRRWSQTGSARLKTRLSRVRQRGVAAARAYLGRLGRAVFRRLPAGAKPAVRWLVRRPAFSGTPLSLHHLILAPPPSLGLARVGQVALRPGQPLVSVIIPCFNYGQFLREAVDSALHQTLRSVEVIVVDDGSTEPLTRTTLDELNLPRTTVLRRPNSGLPAARNQGISAARGRYICCLDADDRLASTYLEKAVALLESDRGVGLVYSWVQLYGDEHDVWYTERFDLAELRRRNFIPVSAVFRREDWDIIGGYAHDMRPHGYEDWEFWLRLGGAGRRGVLIPEALFEHRLHGRTMVFEAREKHAALVAAIAHRQPELYRDDALVNRLATGYAVVPVVPPFVNLESQPTIGRDECRTRAGVLAIVPWLTAGGAEAVLHSVLSGLSGPGGVALTIVTCTPSTNEWQARFAELTEEIYHLPAFLPTDLWAQFVFYLVRSRRVGSVIVSGTPFGYRILPELKREFPGVRTLDILHNASPAGHIDRSVTSTLAIDHHVVVTQLIRDALVDLGIQPSKIHVISNGVDTQLFDPARYDRAEVARALGLDPRRPVLTYIGRLSEEKQPLQFLEAAARLADTETQFILVGDGRQHDAVATRLKHRRLRNRVRWLADVPPRDIPAVLAATDALVMTSAIEGLPIVMLEALAMGVPVFTYDVGDVRVAIDDGRNGRVFEPGNLARLTDGLRQFVLNAANRQALQAVARPSLLASGLTLAAQQRAYTALLVDAAVELDLVRA